MGPRSVACREFVRDIECWEARSLVSSKRVVISRSFVEISTGLQHVKQRPSIRRDELTLQHQTDLFSGHWKLTLGRIRGMGSWNQQNQSKNEGVIQAFYD